MKEKKFSNFELVKGNVTKTIPEYLKNNKHTKVALLHLDMDVYKPTVAALNYFYRIMSKDEYTQNNLITYIGNKRKLLNHIENVVKDIKQKLKKDLITSFDGFSGSGSVSRLLKYHSSD